MADTAGHQQHVNASPVPAQLVTSDVQPSQPSPTVNSLPNGGSYSRGPSAGAPSTPAMSIQGTTAAPPPARTSSTPVVSVPPAPPAPMSAPSRAIDQTPLVPSERPIGFTQYVPSGGMPGRPPNPQRAHFAPQYHAQPAPVYSAQSQPVHQGYTPSQTARPLIVDPPRRISIPPTSIQPQPQTSGGFPSPGRDYGAENRKYNDDLSRITLSFQQSIPEAVRRAVRDNWEKCLLGSEFHQAFVVSATNFFSSMSAAVRSSSLFVSCSYLVADESHLMLD